MKNVFVTGAQGFIGTKLCSFLENKGHTVSKFSGDILKIDELQSEIKKAKFDIVIHMAGISHVETCEKNPDLAYNVNCVGTSNTANVFFESNPNGVFYFFSTAQVYSSSETLDAPIKLHEDSPLLPKSVYSSTKLQGELELKNHFAHKHKTRILRLFNHTHKTQDASFFLPSMYQQLLKLKHSSSRVLNVGNIDVSRDISVVSDIFPKIEKLLVADKSIASNYEVYNVCSGVPRNLRTLIDTLAKKLDIQAEIVVDPARVRIFDPKILIGDSSKLNQLLGLHNHNAQNDSEFINQFLSE